MKKVIFIQNKGKSIGGIWYANKSLAEELVRYNYAVDIISIRDNQNDIKMEIDNKIKVRTINPNDLWEITRKIDIFNNVKKCRIIKGCTLIIKLMKEKRKKKKDFQILTKIIKNEKPDYIINSHYELLTAIPKEYLTKTINVQHSSVALLEDNLPSIFPFYNHYKHKIGKFIWLSKGSCKRAMELGYENSSYIYNIVRIRPKEKANVIKNKKLITIARLDDKIKRIDLMIKIVNEVFKNEKFKDWTFEIYGPGYLNDKTKRIIAGNKQIKPMGITIDPEKILLSSSIYLCTSVTEGFSLSILEATACGVPTVAFRFGESCNEEIINGETGLIIDQKDDETYLKQLMKLMDEQELLEQMSCNAKEFSKLFYPETIVKEWLQLFDELINNGR